MKIYHVFLAALALTTPVLAEPIWFARDAASKQSLEAALAAVQKSNHRLIVMYDGSWCSLCAEVHHVAMADPEVSNLVHIGYEVVHVTTDDSAGLTQFASESLHVKLEKENGLLISVLEKDGSLLAAWTATWLMDQGRLSAEKLKSKLAEYILGAPADEAYRTGLASLPNGKAGWVEFRADWCGWCRKMDKLFAASSAAPILAKYYKVITIDTDKNPGADQLARSLGSPNGTGGLPWFAVVDAKGKALSTAEGPKGNIGYPDTDVEVAHFQSMLKTTAQGISASEIDSIMGTIKAMKVKAAAVPAPATND